MIKKLCLIFAAFTVGLFVSLSLQACADNDDNDPVTKTPTADTHKFDAWKQPGLDYEEESWSSSNGSISTDHIDYEYNDKGWIIKATKTRDDGSTAIWTYTYSDSGDIQYCTFKDGDDILTYTKKIHIQ